MNKRTTVAIPKDFYRDMKHILLDLDMSAQELLSELFYNRYEELKQRARNKRESENNNGEKESGISQGMQKVQ